jgi:hypothetical protein
MAPTATKKAAGTTKRKQAPSGASTSKKAGGPVLVGMSAKAGLQFPANRIRKMLQKG